MFDQLSEKSQNSSLKMQSNDKNSRRNHVTSPMKFNQNTEKKPFLNVKPKPSTRDIILNACYILDIHSFESINEYKEHVETFMKNMYFILKETRGIRKDFERCLKLFTERNQKPSKDLR